MTKELVISVIIVVVIIAGDIFTTKYTNKSIETATQSLSEIRKEMEKENEEDMTNSEQEKNTTKSGSKTLVVYYSAQNHTKAVAEKVAQNLNADIFEIEPEEKYSEEDLNWTNRNSRVSKEHDDESLRDIKLKKDTVDNWSDYDTVLIGYPIWWGIAAWPVDTFVKANDFNGKTVIPFCTSASSGLGQSGKLLEQETNGGDWKNGQRFNERPSDSTIKNWTDSIK